MITVRPALLMIFASLAICLFASHDSHADWQFPSGMKVSDVKTEFGAVGDGKHDDTEALQKAFNQSNRFVYLPNGTYLVRDRLIWEGRAGVGPTIQGQSRDGVVIKLADDATGFDNPQQPRAVVRLIRESKVSADYFKTKIRNLTIDAGQHRGAIGLMFYANNSGQCRNVLIRGQGVAGLDLSYMLNGPLLVSHVEIDGFNIGVKGGSGPYNSQTIEHLTLRHQKQFGIDAADECLSIRGLRSFNSCPAIFTRGNMVLIDSQLTSPKPEGEAIQSARGLFARNVSVEGYKKAIQCYNYDRKAGLGGPKGEAVATKTIREWSTGELESPAKYKSLALPIEETPALTPLDDLQSCVCVDDFGANGNDKEDDTAAIQQAFQFAREHQRSTICFSANARYVVSGELVIDGSISRLQGAHSYLVPPRGQSLKVTVADGTSPTVVIDMIDRPLGRFDVVFENASSRTAVVRSLRAEYEFTGTGRTFIEDTGNRLRISNPKHRVWVRQLNTEMDETNTINTGGFLWVLGLKSEKDQTLVETTNGGQSEVLGGWAYQIRRETPTAPMFRVIDSETSVAGVIQWNFRRRFYETLVEYSRDGLRSDLTRESNGAAAIGLWSTKTKP